MDHKTEDDACPPHWRKSRPLQDVDTEDDSEDDAPLVAFKPKPILDQARALALKGVDDDADEAKAAEPAPPVPEPTRYSLRSKRSRETEAIDLMDAHQPEPRRSKRRHVAKASPATDATPAQQQQFESKCLELIKAQLRCEKQLHELRHVKSGVRDLVAETEAIKNQLDDLQSVEMGHIQLQQDLKQMRADVTMNRLTMEKAIKEMKEEMKVIRDVAVMQRETIRHLATDQSIGEMKAEMQVIRDCAIIQQTQCMGREEDTVCTLRDDMKKLVTESLRAFKEETKGLAAAQLTIQHRIRDLSDFQTSHRLAIHTEYRSLRDKLDQVIRDITGKENSSSGLVVNPPV